MSCGGGATELAKRGLIAGLTGSCHERTVPSREAETIRRSVGEATARTWLCQFCYDLG
jgi:hypothetical protein